MKGYYMEINDNSNQIINDNLINKITLVQSEKNKNINNFFTKEKGAEMEIEKEENKKISSKNKNDLNLVKNKEDSDINISSILLDNYVNDLLENKINMLLNEEDSFDVNICNIDIESNSINDNQKIKSINDDYEMEYDSNKSKTKTIIIQIDKENSNL